MEHVLKRDLHQAFLAIENDRSKQGLLLGHRFHARSVSRCELVEKAWTICNILRADPYLSGPSVCRKSGLDKDQLAVVYKMIQRSNICQDYLKHSENKDYFNVIKHYFNHNFYSVVLFVGTSCPNRCMYCPNVKIDKMGRRRIIEYNSRNVKMTEKILCRVFDDLAGIKRNGTAVLTKISGGLEPLTDVQTINNITRLADQAEIPVKLFTNGVLLNNPERRKVALKTGDIRISLCTTDEDMYQYLCFSHKKPREKNKILPRLKDSIRKLVKERPLINPACKIGFNCIVRPENHEHLIPLMEMARELGIDYIDFKPDYFASLDAKSISIMNESIQEAQTLAAYDSYADIYVNFTGSLSRRHLYWKSWDGTCNALRQSDFKIFITPFGHCSPVHYGAFPHSDSAFQDKLSSYSIGEITMRHGLLDVLTSPSRIPEIELKNLNPFELMLSLEITREDTDKDWGLPLCVSPYHTSQREQVPPDLFFPFEIKD